eukprot:gnl/Ergobibamus_cyprinoides/5163.p2 GENE.gnl/Ergobibamus_cyprinoides/5163~~gnl/Ergobibamus_cyprinoides/5163.p2  ORF type:complete len:134 (+),score=25.85 gnl/Ergobibamus_cyprinoides/5163:27-404(+)
MALSEADLFDLLKACREAADTERATLDRVLRPDVRATHPVFANEAKQEEAASKMDAQQAGDNEPATLLDVNARALALSLAARGTGGDFVSAVAALEAWQSAADTDPDAAYRDSLARASAATTRRR